MNDLKGEQRLMMNMMVMFVVHLVLKFTIGIAKHNIMISVQTAVQI